MTWFWVGEILEYDPLKEKILEFRKHLILVFLEGLRPWILFLCQKPNSWPRVCFTRWVVSWDSIFSTPFPRILIRCVCMYSQNTAGSPMMKAPSLQKQPMISFLKKSILGSLHLFTWFCCVITISALCMKSILKQFCFSIHEDRKTHKPSQSLSDRLDTDNAPKVVLLVVPQSLEPVMARSLYKLFPEWFLFKNDMFTCTVHICTWLYIYFLVRHWHDIHCEDVWIVHKSA